MTSVVRRDEEIDLRTSPPLNFSQCVSVTVRDYVAIRIPCAIQAQTVAALRYIHHALTFTLAVTSLSTLTHPRAGFSWSCVGFGVQMKVAFYLILNAAHIHACIVSARASNSIGTFTIPWHSFSADFVRMSVLRGLAIAV